MPKRPLSRLAALVLSGVLLLTLCSCGDEDFSSLASDASGSSAPEWPSQSALGEWDAFSSEAARKKSFLPSFLRSCRSKVRNRYRLPLHRSRLLRRNRRRPSVSEPSLSDAVSEQTQTQKPAESAGTYTVLTPVASGTEVYSGGGAQIDASNTSEGYVMVKYSGSVSKIRVQITRDGGSIYTYALNNSGSYEVFPLSQGSGGYSINIYENVSGNQYALALGQYISVSLRNSFLPFLYPNQYVNFYKGSQTVAKGARLASTASNDLEVVENIYNYVIHNISYDFNKAANVSFGYLPNVDSILSSGIGICFDYAAVMAPCSGPRISLPSWW